MSSLLGFEIQRARLHKRNAFLFALVLTTLAALYCRVATTAPSLKAIDSGRKLPPKLEREREKLEIRKAVLRDTLEAFERNNETQLFHNLAVSNLERWQEEAEKSDNDSGEDSTCRVEVVPGDWGAVTLDYTQKYGKMFAVLNMANAYHPGGGYKYGYSAQEENMFRRTDCHFSITKKDVVKIGKTTLYTPAMSNLLNGKEGRVYLDTESPRVCIRGPEDPQREDLGYDFLPEDRIFPFVELRAAAVDNRRGRNLQEDTKMKMMTDMRRRIVAQLDTLTNAGMRHVIFGAFGCGEFRNPAHEVAVIYREEIERRASKFDVIVFAVVHSGYSSDIFPTFRGVFEWFNKAGVGIGTDTS